MSSTRNKVDSSSYTEHFYEALAEWSGSSAAVIVPLVLGLAPVGSVLDVGCGVGSWLAAFSAAGVTDLEGIDRDEVPEDLLQVPAGTIRRVDLSRPFDLGRRFDIVVSLEVAEHLPEGSAGSFVASIATHTDFVLFSAAIPGQGGTSHINEQWPHYWADLFARHGFVAVDAIRPVVWDRDDVRVWYAQNSMIYARGEVLDRILAAGHPPARMLDVVHPELWSVETAPLGIRGLVRKVPGALRATFGHRFPGRASG